METEIKPTDRLARERMSRRWTMAKKLLWTFWVLIIVCIVMILFDTEKGKIKSNDIYIVWAGMFLMFGLAFFVIYSKYWHKPLVRRLKRKRR